VNIWLIQTGETLPFGTGDRPMRTGLLASELTRRGHSVRWWGSAFDHFKKEWVCSGDSVVEVSSRLTIHCLKGNGYRKNISLARFVDHRRIAWKFRPATAGLTPPDVIVAASPAYDIAYAAAKYAAAHKVPLLVDIRDPWPDIFLHHVPAAVRPAARALLATEFRMMGALCRQAAGLIAVSNTFLDLGLRYTGRPRQWQDRVFYLGCRAPGPLLPESDAMRAIHARCEGKTVVVFVGNFGEYNDTAILLDAAAQLAARNIVFVIAGDGRNLAAMERRAQSMPNVILPGWLRQDDVDSLLRFSHIGVCPTALEVDLFPNKAFMYMSVGIPVISAFAGDLRKSIEQLQIGRNYAPGDAAALRNHIVELVEDAGLYRRCAENARRQFARSFDAGRIYEDYAEHIESLGGDNTSKTPTFHETASRDNHLGA
jgi:glycosyltransferase involved in cell wall biosynthesis